MLKKIISGGLTVADQAALDAAEKYTSIITYDLKIISIIGETDDIL